MQTRRHIGGNAYDRYDDAGVLIHPYGQHSFHTQSADIFAYLSNFPAWRPYEHRMLASVDGQLLPIPINLDTVNRMYNLSLNSSQFDDYLAGVAEKVTQVRTSEDLVDTFFDHGYGRLPYRSLNFENRTVQPPPGQAACSPQARSTTRTTRHTRASASSNTYNMDQVVAQALVAARRIAAMTRTT